jgi:hypothetical protein
MGNSANAAEPFTLTLATFKGGALMPRKVANKNPQFLQAKGSEEDAKIQRPDLQPDTAAPNDENLKIISGRISSIVRREPEGTPPERQTPTRTLGETAAARN